MISAAWHGLIHSDRIGTIRSFRPHLKRMGAFDRDVYARRLAAAYCHPQNIARVSCALQMLRKRTNYARICHLKLGRPDEGIDEDSTVVFRLYVQRRGRVNGQASKMSRFGWKEAETVSADSRFSAPMWDTEERGRDAQRIKLIPKHGNGWLMPETDTCEA